MIVKEVIKWSPLIIAFIAGWFALKQIRLNNITNSRIKWLDTLKHTIADYIAEVTSLSMKIGVLEHVQQANSLGNFSKKADELADEFVKDKVPQLQRIQLKYDLIKLNLNPREDIHLRMEGILERHMNLLNKLPTVKGEEHNRIIVDMRNCYENLLKVVRIVMKLEWEKTKRTSCSYRRYINKGKGKILKE